MTTSLKKTLIAAAVVPAIALAAACTSGSNDDKSAAADSGSVSAPAPASAPEVADGLSSKDSAAQLSDLDSLDSAYAANGTRAGGLSPENAPEQAETEGQSKTLVQAQSVISKGQISLRSKDIDKTRFELQKLLDTLNGTIADEQSDANKKGKTIRQRLVLRVPSPKFSKAMDGLSKLPGGTLIGRNRSSEDVTTKVIDNATRVRTQRASLARIQALLAQATSLREIISIESQLSRRQAELDSLEAQQKYLADQTSLSTINVYLTVPSKKKAAEKDDDNGFFSGLESGWDHLGSSTSAVLTGIGAVLPFAALGALVGFPAWAAWRRRSPKPAVEPVPAA